MIQTLSLRSSSKKLLRGKSYDLVELDIKKRASGEVEVDGLMDGYDDRGKGLQKGNDIGRGRVEGCGRGHDVEDMR